VGCKILSKTRLSEDLYELKILAPHVTKRGAAGQFIILRVEEKGERIPLTIADLDKENGILTIVFMGVGFTTKKLAQLNEGDEILDLVGPLGVATEIKKYGTVVLVAGGYGAAPCYLISKALKEAGNKVYMIVGARKADLIFWQDKMKSASSELFITTDDGSLGRKGFVTEVLKELMQKEQIDMVMAVGPMPMMKAVADLTRNDKIKTICSLNPIMVDGTGMCGACRVTVGGKVKFACVDGPDFDAHEVDFDEVTQRTKIYREHECNLMKQADEVKKP